MRFGRRRNRREQLADTSGLLSARLQEVQKRHDELHAELAEAQRKVADAGSTRRQLEEQLKALKGRPEAESIAERYEQATVSEKKLISYASEARKNLDLFIVQKKRIEEQVERLRSLTEAD